VFYLDIQPELAVKRLNARSGQNDYYEDCEKLEKIHKLYSKVWNSFSHKNPVTVAADMSVEAIHNFIYEVTKTNIKKVPRSKYSDLAKLY
jgi:thymidylate kinase